MWNWQLNDWPNFTYDKSQLSQLEDKFLHISGLLFGAIQHVNTGDKNTLLIEILSEEALDTSAIEGSFLNRESLQLSLIKNFGLNNTNLNDRTIARHVPLAEQGIANLMVDLYTNYEQKLTHEAMFAWHKMITLGRTDLDTVGGYRVHEDDMQIVSGLMHKPTIHFVAPPSVAMPKEMDLFIQWFNKTEKNKNTVIPALARAGIAHLYFVAIHPFEDGNGRIARALAQKVLCQSVNKPLLLAISRTIKKNIKAYYKHLNASNKSLDITPWLVYFANLIIDSHSYTNELIKFIITKTKFYDLHKDKFNTRQEKVIEKLFAAGPDGFFGGLSAENYISITRAARATATRDLHDLVKKQILFRTGELKSTRYYLNLIGLKTI